MSERDAETKDLDGTTALSICESLLIALRDLNVLNDKEAHDVLEDAAASHRRDAALNENAEAHEAIAQRIETVMGLGPRSGLV